MKIKMKTKRKKRKIEMTNMKELVIEYFPCAYCVKQLVSGEIMYCVYQNRKQKKYYVAGNSAKQAWKNALQKIVRYK